MTRDEASTATIEWAAPEWIAPDENDPRIQAALAELRERILQSYPAVTFDTFVGAEGDMIWLEVTADIDDPDEVRSVVSDRIVDMQSEEGLPVSVMVLWPAERYREYFRQQAVSPAEERGAPTAQGAAGSGAGHQAAG